MIVLLASMAGGCSFRPSGPEEEKRSEQERIEQGLAEFGIRVDLAKAEELAAKGAPEARLDIPVRSHHFGILDPGEEVAHEFEITNTSDEPVSVRLLTTSCSCTTVELPDDELAPGEAFKVKLEAEIEEESGEFDYGAEFWSDDPGNGAFVLRIKGTLRKLLAASPEHLMMMNVKPNESNRRRVTVYSQVWNDFELEKISVTEGWTVEMEKASDEQLEEHEGRSGYVVVVTAPEGVADAETGIFWAAADLRGTPLIEGEARPDDAKDVRIAIDGKVLARADFIHKKMWAGSLRIGTLMQGEGAEENVTIKLWDDIAEMHVEGMEVTPNFLEADVEPMLPNGEKGLYYMKLRIPPESPTCDYNGEETASVTLHTDHPTVPTIVLPIEFAIGAF